MHSFPSREEASLGVLDYDAVFTARQQSSKKKWEDNKFSDEKRYIIRKHASVQETSAAVKKIKKSHCHLNFVEFTDISLRAKCQELLKIETAGE